MVKKRSDPADRFTHIYGNEAEALKALRTEPEYKDYF